MRVHPSKVDAWLVAALGISVIVSLFGAGIVLTEASIATWVLAALIAGVGAGLPIWLLLATRYTLDGERLTVQCGPFRWRIPIAEISAITPTRNPLSSPALSLDRLRIDYGSGLTVMISPSDKDQFLRDIESSRGGAS